MRVRVLTLVLAFGPTVVAGQSTHDTEALQKVCDGGNAQACANLGDRYFSGQWVPKDGARAAQLYARAAQLSQRACDNRNADGCFDQAVLAEVAQTAGERDREVAVRKLTDQAILAHIAKNDESDHVRHIARWAAVKKLTDQAVLAQIAKNDKEKTLRAAAAETLTDQRILAVVATNDDDWQVRHAAVRNWRLTDQAVLGQVAMSDRYYLGSSRK